MDFRIDASDLTRLSKRFADAPDIIGDELLRVMRGIGADTERGAKTLVVVDTGETKGSIFARASRITGGAKTVVGATARQALAVENGRSPGSRQPPSAPIAAWLARNGGDPSRAFLVARSIGRRGIRARPFVKPSVERAIRESGRHTRPAVSRIRARLLA